MYTLAHSISQKEIRIYLKREGVYVLNNNAVAGSVENDVEKSFVQLSFQFFL
jgi:hypothetical protein